jgi:succinate dehydrogenase hydrophobic anchor subunit
MQSIGVRPITLHDALRVLSFGPSKGTLDMRCALRIFGVLNIVATLFGLYYFAWGIRIHLGRWPGNPDQKEWAAFLAISAISTTLVLYSAWLGVRLIKQDRNALKQVILVFAIEIALVIGCFFATWMMRPISIPEDVLWFWSIALFPLDPQVLFGYAFFGIFVSAVLILFGRRSPNPLAKASAPVASDGFMEGIENLPVQEREL